MTLTKEVLILIFTISGLSLKLADLYGEQNSSCFQYIFAIISGGCMGLLISYSPISSSIVLGVIMGVTLAGKLDQPNMIIGLGLTLATAMMVGFNLPEPFLLIIVAIASLIDEVGHDNIASRGVLTIFFQFRMVLKIAMILLTILGWVDIIYVLSFFCFDISYDGLSYFLLFLKR